MELQELEIEALKLTPDSRAKLAETLLSSLEGDSDQENERNWSDEALRRHNELENGMARSRPAVDVFRDARSRLK